ncbi:MAG: hypothetical protein K2Z25_21145 [Beijerinckiaceae bacterium]|nr:hypothetical protein [Beijerinckiaceae bacterium]
MTTPAEIIAALDTSLAEHGEAILLRRRVGTGSTFVEVACRAKVAGYASEVLVQGIKQTASTFIISPTAITAAVTAGTWPGAAGGDTWPRVGDFIRQTIGGDRRIEATRPLMPGGQVVRIEAKVLG